MNFETRFDIDDKVWVIAMSLEGRVVISGVVKDIELGGVIDGIDPQYNIKTDVGTTFIYESGLFGMAYPNTLEGKKHAKARLKELNENI